MRPAHARSFDFPWLRFAQTHRSGRTIARGQLGLNFSHSTGIGGEVARGMTLAGVSDCFRSNRSSRSTALLRAKRLPITERSGSEPFQWFQRFQPFKTENTVPMVPIVPRVPTAKLPSRSKACPEGLEGLNVRIGWEGRSSVQSFIRTPRIRGHSVIDWFRLRLYTSAHEIVYQ